MQERLRANGVSFMHHYPMTAACAPSRASLLTGQHPSLHGVSQTDGLTKGADGDDMFWLAPDGVPTMGDWFRAGGYRTYFKGKWHASHAHLDADDGDGLSALDRRRRGAAEGEHRRDTWRRISSTRTASPSGSARSPTASASTTPGRSRTCSPRTRRSSCCERLDGDESDEPWLAVCSFLNPHDDSMFGIIALTQGLRYHPSTVPHVRTGADPRRGPLDQARLPAEHGRPVGNDPRAATVEQDAPEVLLPAAGNGRRADHQGARRAGGERRLREHDRGLHVGSRRPAGLAQRDAREVALRLRGGAACAVRRVRVRFCPATPASSTSRRATPT